MTSSGKFSISDLVRLISKTKSGEKELISFVNSSEVSKNGSPLISQLFSSNPFLIE